MSRNHSDRCQAWKQLQLRPTLPIETHRDAIRQRLHIDINHCRDDMEVEEQRSPGKSPGIPFADVKPPSNVPCIALHSVQLSIDLAHTRARAKSVTKRKSSLPAHPIVPQINDQRAEESLPSESGSKRRDVAFFDDENLEDKAQLTDSMVPKVNTVVDRKRRLASTTANTQLSARSVKRLKHLATSSVIIHERDEQLSVQQVATFVDAALCFSIRNSLPRNSIGLKIKATTFSGGLADVAPSLWMPGYLSVCCQLEQGLIAHLQSPGIVSESLLAAYHQSISRPSRSKNQVSQFATGPSHFCQPSRHSRSHVIG